MIDPDFDPYNIIEQHAEAISNLIVAMRDASDTQLKATKAMKEFNNGLVKMYTEMKQLEHRIARLERQHYAFEQTTADNCPKQ